MRLPAAARTEDDPPDRDRQGPPRSVPGNGRGNVVVTGRAAWLHQGREGVARARCAEKKLRVAGLRVGYKVPKRHGSGPRPFIKPYQQLTHRSSFSLLLDHGEAPQPSDPSGVDFSTTDRTEHRRGPEREMLPVAF